MTISSALGIMVFKLSTCSVLNICLISGRVKPLETSFLQQWQVSGAVAVMFSQGNIAEAGGWRSDIQPIPMLEGGFTCVYAVQTSMHLKKCILDDQRDYAISSNNYTSAQLMSDLNLPCCKIRQFLHILFPMIQESNQSLSSMQLSWHTCYHLPFQLLIPRLNKPSSLSFST